MLDNGTLLIETAAREDRGYYHCTASNGMGKPLGRAVFLTVLGTASDETTELLVGTRSSYVVLTLIRYSASAVPAHFERPTQTVRAVRGSAADLECLAEGDAPLSLHWTREGKRVDELKPKEEATDVGVKSRYECDRARCQSHPRTAWKQFSPFF